MQKDDQKLFEDINLQYIEPLEGEDEESNNDELSYNKYLKGVNKELNIKKEEINFINDLGLNNNLLNTKELFDKIKKQNKVKTLKTQNSFISLNKIIIKNNLGYESNIIDIEDLENENNKDIKKDNKNKEKIYKHNKIKSNKLDTKLESIKNSLLSKIEIKKYIENEKRIMTYNNNRKNINEINKKEIMLNINEKKKFLRRIKSGRIYQKLEKIKKGIDKNNSSKKYIKNNICKEVNETGNDTNEKEDIFGNKKKKKNEIIELFNILDDEVEKKEKEKEDNVNGSKKYGSGIEVIKIQKKEKTTLNPKNEVNNDKNEEIKNDIEEIKNDNDNNNDKEEEIKKEGYIHPLVKLEQDIKKINMKLKKAKKNPINPESKKDEKIKKKYLFLNKKNNIYKNRNKETNNGKIEDNINNKNNRLKSPAINSILNDISSLSKLVIGKTRDKKNKRKHNNIYQKHFGYEYWKENEFRKTYLYPLSSNKRGFNSFKSLNSTNAPDDNYSNISSNLSWFLKKNNEHFLDEYNDLFLFKRKENFCNPYSIKWTKNILKNSYNRTIKLKKRISGIPQIELMSRSKSSLSILQPNINYNYNFRNYVDSKNKKFFKKNNNMYGRIYNNNEVEFPFIYKS